MDTNKLPTLHEIIKDRHIKMAPEMINPLSATETKAHETPTIAEPAGFQNHFSLVIDIDLVSNSVLRWSYQKALLDYFKSKTPGI